MSLASLLISFYLLAVIVEEFFVPSLDRISNRLKLPSDVAGATFMAVGSSAPELFVSLFALLRPGSYANVGTGTIVGSAIFNILVIVGASAAYKAAKLNWQPVIRDLIFYCASIVVLLASFWDGTFVLLEAFSFVALYVVYIVIVMKWKSWFPYRDVDPIVVTEEEIDKHILARFSKLILSYIIPDPQRKPNAYVLTFSLSIAAIAALSYVLVESGVMLGEALHISPTIIALTVLAAGTSIPDLLSSIIVAKQGRGDMAVSNAVGSNVFDILFALGFPLLIVIATQGTPVTVDTANLVGSVILLFATVVSLLTLLIVRRWHIGRHAGLLLIGLYILYLVYAGWTSISGV